MMLLWWLWTLICLGWIGYGVYQYISLPKRILWFIPLLLLGRWLIIPWTGFEPVGHSARYLAVFTGEIPVVGDTSFYPSMQIVWWLLGHLSLGMLHPSFWASLIGGLSICWLTTDEKEVCWWPFVWLALCIEHMVWSSSIYNVIFPFAMLTLAVRFAKSTKWEFVSMSMAMAVAWRMETVLFWGVLLAFLPIWDWKVLVRSMWGTVLSLVLLSTMSVPGEGDYLASISHNWWLWSYYQSFLIPLVMGMVFVRKQQVGRWLWMVGWLLVHHGILSTFSDFSGRHLLWVSIVVVLLYREMSQRRLAGPLVWGTSILFNAWLLYSQFPQLQRNDQAFQEWVQQKYSGLPSLTIEQAMNRSCGWIVEVYPFSEHPLQPERSHFNLLQASEVYHLIEEYGCIDWCYTTQDWEWSELGVRDRALRLNKMYTWEATAIVYDEQQICLLQTMVPSFMVENEHDHVR